MAKKQYFLTVDTETTQDSLVADFGATVTDKKGNVLKEIGVLVDGIYTDYEKHPLFFTSDTSGIWSKRGQDKRYKLYEKLIANGGRMIASVAAINRWLVKVKLAYPNIILTAYNLSFDVDKCKNTLIDLEIFDRRFCLWQAAYTHWAHTTKYKNFCLSVHGFNAPTSFGNMTFKTNAEIMTRFVTDNPELEDEPHTALEDILFYELIILNRLLQLKSAKWLLNNPKAYNWRDCQVKDHFTAI